VTCTDRGGMELDLVVAAAALTDRRGGGARTSRRQVRDPGEVRSKQWER
jgi:hypothetical protein